MIGDDVYLLIHPDVIIDVRLLVDSARGHRKQSESHNHLLTNRWLLGHPIANPIDELLQSVFGLLFAGALEEVALEADAKIAVQDGMDEGRTDDFLVQRVAASPNVGVDHLASIAAVRANFSEGLFVDRMQGSIVVEPPFAFR